MTACAICERPIEPAPRYFTAAGNPRHMLCEEDTPMTATKGLRTLDSLGSARATDAPVEAICWTHRGGGWDVHYTADHPYPPAGIKSMDGQAVRTKREAYALVRAMRDQWRRADLLRLMNDPRSWD